MNDDKTKEVALPTHLTRYEKRALRMLLDEQIKAGKSISVARVDAAADYVSARSRIRTLTRSWRAAIRERDTFVDHQRQILCLCRQLDATVKLAKQIAADLGLD